MITVLGIYAVASDEFSVSIEDLLSPSHARRIARPRQVAWYVARRHTRRSFPEIAATAKRDHTTIIYGVQNVEALMLRDEAFAASVRRVLDRVRAKSLSRGETVVFYTRRKPVAYQEGWCDA